MWIGAEAKKDDEALAFLGFQLQKVFFSHDQQLSVVAMVNLPRTSCRLQIQFSSRDIETLERLLDSEFDKLWLTDQNIFKSPTQTSSFSNPELVQNSGIVQSVMRSCRPAVI